VYSIQLWYDIFFYKARWSVERDLCFCYNARMSKTLCPCGSQKQYSECCGPVIKGERKASTAEELMRSRYSAYVMHEIDHIARSCVQDPDKNEIDLEETRRWSEESSWQGLKIIRV
jgi:SEC-C motif domain protein